MREWPWRAVTKEEAQEIIRRTDDRFDLLVKRQRGEEYWTGRVDNMGLGFRTVSR